MVQPQIDEYDNATPEGDMYAKSLYVNVNDDQSGASGSFYNQKNMVNIEKQ